MDIGDPLPEHEKIPRNPTDEFQGSNGIRTAVSSLAKQKLTKMFQVPSKAELGGWWNHLTLSKNICQLGSAQKDMEVVKGNDMK